MKAQEFIDKYYPYALQVEKETGISAIAMLAQSAGESGWKEAKGNMMFGIKDTDGLNGNEQLITTTEYFPTDDVKLPYIYWIKKVKKGNAYVYKYKCKDYFRKYDTPYESFKNYAIFVKTNPRYSKAWEVRQDPYQYLREIARAGYATSPNYETFMMMMINSIKKRL